MKKTVAIIMLLVSGCCLTGCDLFRILAGGPTSAEIAEKKESMEAKAEAEAEAEAEAARSDSEEENDGYTVQDSIEVSEYISSHPSLVVKSEKLGLHVKDAIPADYCVVIGSFGHRDNAERLAAMVTAAGYDSFLFPCSGSLTAVGVSPTNSIVDAYRTLAKLLNEKFCPKDAWILDAR